MPHCFARGCKNYDKKKAKVSYHYIPKGTSIKYEWLTALGRPLDTFLIQQRVCSNHFLDSDFVQNGSVRRLRPGVVPTLNLQVINDPSARSSLDSDNSNRLFKSEPVPSISGIKIKCEESGETHEENKFTYYSTKRTALLQESKDNIEEIMKTLHTLSHSPEKAKEYKQKLENVRRTRRRRLTKINDLTQVVRALKRKYDILSSNQWRS